MRILHVVPTYIPAYRYGGPIFAVHGLCKALAKLGNNVHVFTTNVDGERDSNVPLGIPINLDSVKVWYFPSKRLRRLYWSPPMQKELEKQIREFDIVHLHSIFLWPTWAAARLARKYKKPYIISPRGMLVKELIERKSRFAKNLWISLIERKNLEHAAAIHVTTESEKEEAQKFGINLPRIFIIPNGVDINNGETDQKQIIPNIGHIINKKPYLLFLGRINWKKGLDRLIPALKFVPDIPLISAGNDEENYKPKLETIAVTYGVLKRINFIGPVYGEDKTALLKNASALVLPSYSENFGNVVLEAMAVGCPVVVTPEVGVSDIVQKSGAGLVVKGNPETLGKEIRNILSNPDQCINIGMKGKKVVKEKFTWNTVAGQMDEVYRKVRDSYKK